METESLSKETSLNDGLPQKRTSEWGGKHVCTLASSFSKPPREDGGDPSAMGVMNLPNQFDANPGGHQSTVLGEANAKGAAPGNGLWVQSPPAP